MRPGELILTLACPDRRGIVYAVARAIADGGGNILDSQQFGDPDEGVFFMRVHFADDGARGPRGVAGRDRTGRRRVRNALGAPRRGRIGPASWLPSPARGTA